MTSSPRTKDIRPFDADQYVSFLSHCPGKHRALVPLIGKGLRERLKKPLETGRFIDIGAGTGRLMEGVLSTFQNEDTKSRSGRIPKDVLYMEPDPAMYKTLSRQVTEPNCLESGRRKHLILGKYAPTDNEVLTAYAPYQFILASHVFYYLSDWALTVRHFLDALSTPGVLCIVMKSFDTDLYRLRSELHWPSTASDYLSYRPFAESLEPVLKECCVYEKESFSTELSIPQRFLTSCGKESLRGLFQFLYMMPTNCWTAEVLEELADSVTSILNKSPNRVLEYKEVIFWIQSKDQES